jgi:SAM-dependent methyltransferase/tetratricopeptide (TPR) repeat protein
MQQTFHLRCFAKAVKFCSLFIFTLGCKSLQSLEVSVKKPTPALLLVAYSSKIFLERHAMIFGKKRRQDAGKNGIPAVELLRQAGELAKAGKPEAALDACTQCLEADPANVDAHILALQLIREVPALGLSPEDYSEPYNGEALQKAYAARIQALQGAGRLSEALVLARTLCMLAPDNSQCWIVAGILCLGLGKHDDAISIFDSGLERMPGDIFFRAQLIKVLLLSGFDRYDEKLRRRIGLFLRDPATVNLAFLSRVWLMFLTRDPAFAPLLEGADCKDYASFRAWFDGRDFTRNLTDDYFLDGVRNCVVADVRVERLLVYLRQRLLDYAAGGAPPWALQLAVAIGEQCFVNEYVFEETPQETQKVETLDVSNSLAAAVYASYRPLHSLKNRKFPDDPALRGLIRQQITEPAEEDALKKKIGTFGKIADETSQLVRAQYEENPYPRWISFGRLPDDTDDVVLDNADCLKPLNILVAGCATGHFPIRVSINYPFAQVTAIDISLSSLAYGMRKARDMGAKNIEFRHGDILDAGKLGEKFDIIFSLGVLHHMRDPEQGWCVLTSVLKPGGLMKIGLYPELERKHITEGRRFIAQNNLPATPEGIRRMRRIIMERPEDDPIRKVMPFNDFYSTSMMRDLLFHVQEQTFTIPRIKKDMAELGLEFIKFSPLSGQELAQYSAMFPDDPAMTNLDHWDVFEHKYPDTFLGLYQFWCRK